jgi:hypothetical protein
MWIGKDVRCPLLIFRVEDLLQQHRPLQGGDEESPPILLAQPEHHKNT